MNIVKKLNSIKFKDYLNKHKLKYLDSPKAIKVGDQCSVLYVDGSSKVVKSGILVLYKITLEPMQLSIAGGGLDNVYTFLTVDPNLPLGMFNMNDPSRTFYNTDYNKLWVILK